MPSVPIKSKPLISRERYFKELAGKKATIIVINKKVVKNIFDATLIGVVINLVLSELGLARFFDIYDLEVQDRLFPRTH